MKRNALNYGVDGLTFLVIAAMAWTGLVIRYVLPPGTGARHGGHGLALWGGGRHDWGDVHTWLAIGLGVLLVVHVALHWSWVCTMSLRLMARSSSAKLHLQPRSRHLYGIGVLSVLAFILGGGVWLAKYNVTEVANLPAPETHDTTTVTTDEHDDGGIRGRMSLQEVSDATGVDIDLLRHRLKLPDTVSSDERMGRLSQRYGFSMTDVRQAAIPSNAATGPGT